MSRLRILARSKRCFAMPVMRSASAKPEWMTWHRLISPPTFLPFSVPRSAPMKRQISVLLDELRLLERRVRTARATLGICLGAQLIARALGSPVYPGARKEIGWGPLELTTYGRHSPLQHLDTVPVLHWHGDTFDLPDGADRLASTAVTANQAFAVGPAIFALQFHAEVEAKNFERWLIGHRLEIASVAGLSVGGLRDDAQRFAATRPVTACACYAIGSPAYLNNRSNRARRRRPRSHLH